jgi:predicted RNA-binding Zn ribbon-like protein
MTTSDECLSTPLPGVPIALDLLNTEWLEDEPFDLLAVPDGVESWLRSHHFDPRLAARARDPLVQTRQAIHDVATTAGPQYAQLNRVLAHATVRVQVDDTGHPIESLDVDRPEWLPAVRAAMNLIELLAQAPDRIRRCAHPDCILWFFDTTRNGSRRWCSMADCGNRAKAKRHYQRTRARQRR